MSHQPEQNNQENNSTSRTVQGLPTYYYPQPQTVVYTRPQSPPRKQSDQQQPQSYGNSNQKVRFSQNVPGVTTYSYTTDNIPVVMNQNSPSRLVTSNNYQFLPSQVLIQPGSIGIVNVTQQQQPQIIQSRTPTQSQHNNFNQTQPLPSLSNNNGQAKTYEQIQAQFQSIREQQAAQANRDDRTMKSANVRSMQPQNQYSSSYVFSGNMTQVNRPSGNINVITPNQQQNYIKKAQKPQSLKPGVIILQQEQKIRQLQLEIQSLKINSISKHGQVVTKKPLPTESQSRISQNPHSNNNLKPEQQDQNSTSRLLNQKVAPNSEEAKQIQDTYEKKLQEERQKFSQYQTKFEDNTNQLEKILIELRGENSKLKDKILNYQKIELQNQELQDQVRNLTNEKTMLDSDKNELQQRLLNSSSGKFQNSPFRQKEQQFRDEMDDVKQKFEARLAMLNQQIEVKDKESEQQVNNLKKQIAEQNYREQLLKGEIQIKENTILNKDNEKETLQKEINVLKQNNQSLGEKEQQIKQFLEESYQQQIQNLNQEIINLQTQNQQNNQQIQDQSIQNDQEKSQLQLKIQEQQQELQQLNNQLQYEQEQNQKQTQKIEDLLNQQQEELSQQQDNYENMLAEEKKSKEEILDNQQKYQEQQQEQIKNLLTQKQELESKQTELENQISRNKLEYDNSILEKERQISDLKNDNKENANKLALQEEFRKEQEESFKKLLKQKDVELQIIHDDFEQKIKSAMMVDQSMDLGSQKSSQQNLQAQSFKKSLKSRKTKKSQQPINNSSYIGQNEDQSQRSITTSQRSKQETRSLYKKMSQMSSATAAMMSSKLDFNSLKEMTQSQDNLEDEIAQAKQQIIDEHNMIQESQQHEDDEEDDQHPQFQKAVEQSGLSEGWQVQK